MRCLPTIDVQNVRANPRTGTQDMIPSITLPRCRAISFLAIVIVACALPATLAGAAKFLQDKDWPQLPEGWKFRMVCAVAGDSTATTPFTNQG